MQLLPSKARLSRSAVAALVLLAASPMGAVSAPGAPPPPPTTIPAAAASAYYGPIKAGESLSTVGIAVSEATGVHVAQAMWAIYDANRGAFDGNINRLRVGYSLTIPTPDAMTRVSIREARGLIRDEVFADGAMPPAAEQDATPAPGAQPQAAAAAAAKPRPTTVPMEPEPSVTAPQDDSFADTPDAFADAPDAFADAPDAFADAPDAFADAPDAFADAPDAFGDAEGAQVPEQSDATVAPAAPVQQPQAPSVDYTESESAGTPAWVNWLLLAIVLTVFGLLAVFQLSRLRGQREREAEQEAAREQAARRRSGLADLARGQPIQEPSEPDAAAAFADTTALDEPVILEPPTASDPAPSAAETDNPAFAKTVVMEAPIVSEQAADADAAKASAEAGQEDAAESSSPQDDPAFEKTMVLESPIIPEPPADQTTAVAAEDDATTASAETGQEDTAESSSPQDNPAFEKTMVLERPIIPEPPADKAADVPEEDAPAAEDDPAFAKTMVMESPIIPPQADQGSASDEDSSQQSFDDGIKPGDDISSTLDLARGYVDMGEAERARDLLNEVIRSGDAEQQAEARRLLEGLSN